MAKQKNWKLKLPEFDTVENHSWCNWDDVKKKSKNPTTHQPILSVEDQAVCRHVSQPVQPTAARDSFPRCGLIPVKSQARSQPSDGRMPRPQTSPLLLRSFPPASTAEHHVRWYRIALLASLGQPLSPGEATRFPAGLSVRIPALC